jgi:type IV pilus biogenesis protein CpaD/CtpE
MLLSAKRKINEKDYMRIINETVYNPFFCSENSNMQASVFTTALLIKPHIVSTIHVYSMLVSLLPI